MTTVSRRELLLAGGSLFALRAMGAKAARPFFQRTHLPVGIQLYTVGEDLKRDFDGTLGAISKIGYKTVELAGLLDRSPADWRRSLDRAHLQCPSTHIAARPFRGGPSLNDDLGVIAEGAHLMGIRTVVCPSFYIPDRFSLQPQSGEGLVKMLVRLGSSMTVDDWKWNADYLNAKGAALKRLGLRFAYHNHNLEFAPLGKTTAMAVLIRGTDPALVSFEMDAGWVASAGVDPAALLSQYPGRFTAMHVKDMRASTRPNFELQIDPCEIGQGVIDWHGLLAKAYASNTRQFYVEQEPPYSKPPLESVAISFEYLNALVA
jgi:sugar phosphate isomerase/epimerase